MINTKKSTAGNDESASVVGTNNPDALIDCFYSNVEEMAILNSLQPSNEQNAEAGAEEAAAEDDAERFPDPKPPDCEAILVVNPSLGDYVKKHEYAKASKLLRENREKKWEAAQARRPKNVSMDAYVRLFMGYSNEYTYMQIQRMIETGALRRYVIPADACRGLHPVSNYQIHQFLRHTDYEGYLAGMLVPPVFKHMETTRLNPRYALLSYVNFVNGEDRAVQINGKQSTYKAIVYTIFNYTHLNTYQTIAEAFGGGCEPVAIKDNANDERIERFLLKLWRLSEAATYLSAIAQTIRDRGEFKKILVKRFDSASDHLYTCLKTDRLLIRVDDLDTFYYGHKDGTWIYNIDRSNYYATSIQEVYTNKITL